MKTIILLVLYPILVLTAIVEWGPTVKVSGNSNTKRFAAVHHCSGTDVTHIFWEELGDDRDYHLFYRTRLGTGQLTQKKMLSGDRPVTEFYNQISVQATEDGKHILLAYGGYRTASSKGCTTRNEASCIETYFTESFDGGNTWSTPAKVNRINQHDLVHRSMPSMSLEKDTGRVYITYLYDMNSAMIVREPGKITFDMEKTLTVYTYSMTMNMGYTISKKDNKRYLHLVWYENDLEKSRTIYYARSGDGGDKWEERIVLVKRYKEESVPTLAIDTDSAEGGIYVQYVDNQMLKVLWSKDHGKTWEAPINVEKALSPYAAMTICGQTNKGKVFTMNHGLPPISGSLNYFDATSPNIKYLPYPFNEVKGAKNPTLHCSKGKRDGEFTLAAAILDPGANEFFVIQGKMTE